MRVELKIKNIEEVKVILDRIDAASIELRNAIGDLNYRGLFTEVTIDASEENDRQM